MRSEQVNVLGVGVHPVDLEEAVLIVEAKIRKGEKGYVCLAGVHGIMEAQSDPALKIDLCGSYFWLLRMECRPCG